ncbi:MAG: hypothetical protein JWN99_2860, partial [Ilumatobacteraceae bacterium]|nr:hypothetical protein [Ilumatobacteraceae bacterium]
MQKLADQRADAERKAADDATKRRPTHRK